MFALHHAVEQSLRHGWRKIKSVIADSFEEQEKSEKKKKICLLLLQLKVFCPQLSLWGRGNWCKLYALYPRYLTDFCLILTANLRWCPGDQPRESQ